MAVYSLYGTTFESHFPFRLIHPLPDHPAVTGARLIERGECWFRQRTPLPGLPADEWFWSHNLTEDTLYLGWVNLCEFMIQTRNREVAYRLLDPHRSDVFESYLLQQVLSFLAIAEGREFLHGSAVTWHGCGLAFLGESGYGKSTLVAAILRQGGQLISDDALVFATLSSGEWGVMPGPGQLKLYPDSLQETLPDRSGTTLNPVTNKAILTWSHRMIEAQPVQGIFVLAPPESDASTGSNGDIVIQRLSGVAAVQTLYTNLFNPMVHHIPRQTRLLTSLAALVRDIPIYLLSYPRNYAALPGVLNMIHGICADSHAGGGNLP